MTIWRRFLPGTGASLAWIPYSRGTEPTKVSSRALSENRFSGSQCMLASTIVVAAGRAGWAAAGAADTIPAAAVVARAAADATTSRRESSLMVIHPCDHHWREPIPLR